MISFNVRQASEHLLKNGVVYTMRRKRHEGWTALFVSGEYKGEVSVELIGPVSETLLAPYVAHSGFKDYSDWMSEAARVHGTSPENLLIYKVTMTKGESVLG